MEEKEKNSEKEIFTPNELNDYINVVKPSVWVISFAVIVLFIGAAIWSVFGHIEDTVDSITIVKDFDCKTFILEKDISRVKPSMTLRINDKEYSITSANEYGQSAEFVNIVGDQDITVGDFKGKVKVMEIEVGDISTAGLTNGIYKGQIIAGDISPIYFLIN